MSESIAYGGQVMLLLVFVILMGYCYADRNDDHIARCMPITVEEAPWTASYGGVYAAVILRSNWILTTARWGNYKFVKVKGTTLNSTDGEIIPIEEEFYHPQYSNVTHDYDFRLLRLERDIEFDNYAQAIQIGDESMIAAESMLNLRGWRPLSPDCQGSCKSLITAPIYMADCKQNYTDRYFCAEYLLGGGCPCVDGGGPVMDGNKLVGLHSFSTGRCGEAGALAVCGNVVLVKNWIMETMGNTESSSEEISDKKPPDVWSENEEEFWSEDEEYDEDDEDESSLE